ncbi:MAG TPA: hypothetical protein VJZ26_11960 [Blastocatellia bacterium]|nr:hypothetical protein [Blastocatellia bacterium]
MAFEKLHVVLKVIAALDELGIPYLIGGSFASSLYGWARSTNDADLLAAIGPGQATALAEMLESEFYVDELAIKRATQSGRHFNVIHNETAFKVDIFIAKPGGFAEKQIARRQLRTVSNGPEHKAYFASPEDTVLAKLEWYRRGNEVSDLQWRDVLNVLKVQGGNLDLEYMRHWARELGVADLLEQALTDAKNI